MNPFAGLNPGGWGVPTSSGDFVSVLRTVITTVYSIAGVLSFGYLVYGGYKIIMSTGDPQKLKEGQDTVAYALAGVVVVVTSGVIFNFIANKLGVGDIITVLSLPTQ